MGQTILKGPRSAAKRLTDPEARGLARMSRMPS